jgi:hypothetical protein
MAVEKIYSANPIDIMYSGIMFVQKWRSLLKESDQGKITRLFGKDAILASSVQPCYSSVL